jgi:hypothetical protein
MHPVRTIRRLASVLVGLAAGLIVLVTVSPAAFARPWPHSAGPTALVTPWPGGLAGDLPGELFFLQRPPGSSPLHVSVRGDEYHLMHLSSGHLTSSRPTAPRRTRKTRCASRARPTTTSR